jgi:hypothetical protein
MESKKWRKNRRKLQVKIWKIDKINKPLVRLIKEKKGYKLLKLGMRGNGYIYYKYLKCNKIL